MLMKRSVLSNYMNSNVSNKRKFLRAFESELTSYFNNGRSFTCKDIQTAMQLPYYFSLTNYYYNIYVNNGRPLYDFSDRIHRHMIHLLNDNDSNIVLGQEYMIDKKRKFISFRIRTVC